jgi:hypothetical protein
MTAGIICRRAVVDELGVSPVDIIPPWLSMLVYHLGMNSMPVGGRSSETVSPHRYEQHHSVITFCLHSAVMVLV